ncbi:MAG: hypothetical protein DBX61_03945 [Clostridiales bacterium]|nr:MAG: hypothetical protein DBX61_03945 [Clostridiales bacterium]
MFFPPFRKKHYKYLTIISYTNRKIKGLFKKKRAFLLKICKIHIVSSKFNIYNFYITKLLTLKKLCIYNNFADCFQDSEKYNFNIVNLQHITDMV